jgi:peptidoglycan/LPS O-acetylase OafA/YrhL
VGTVRFLLALSVAIAHSPGSTLFGLSFLPPITAVQAFYIISGFLITMVLNERADYRSKTNFYIARCLRLWPAYILVAALSFVLIKFSAFRDEFTEWTPFTGLFVIFSNLTLIFQDWFYFLQVDQGTLVPKADVFAGPVPQLYYFLVIPQAWTLGVELTFYLVAPLFCRSVIGAAALFMIGLAVRLAVGVWRPPLDPWCYRFAPAEMMLFGAGGLAYFCGRHIKIKLSPPVVKCGSWICLGVLVATIIDFIDVRAFARHLYFDETVQVMYLQGPGFLLLVVVFCPILFYAFRGIGWDVLLGELSYPIYISHFFVLDVLSRIAPEAYLTSSLLALSCIVAFSAVLLILVSPLDRFRARFGARISQTLLSRDCKLIWSPASRLG